MSSPYDSETIPQSGFDPVVFWIQHKNKILMYAALFVVASIAFVLYQVTTRRKMEEAQQIFAKATTTDDYRQIVEKYPHSVVGGNATLLLAGKLRDAKKYDDAITVLRKMINDYPGYPLIDGAWLSLGATLQAQGKSDEALSTYQQVVTQFATHYSAPQALYTEGVIQKSRGKIDEAKRIFENLKAQFPDSIFAANAMQELQELQK